MMAMGPSWLSDSFAAVMVAVAAVCVVRLVLWRAWGRRTHVDVDVTHVVMGVAMAGMLVADLYVLTAHVWEAIFSLLSVWFAAKSARFLARRGLAGVDDDHFHHVSHDLTHLVMSLAMLYMYLAPGGSSSGGTGMRAPGGTAADFVGLPLVFLVVLLASGIWELDGVVRFCTVVAPAALAGAGAVQAGVPSGVGAGSSPLAADPPAMGSEASPWLAPRLDAWCHVAMCVTMAYMLVLML